MTSAAMKREPRNFMEWIWRNGWSDSFGRVFIIDEKSGYSVWRSRIATAKRYVYWLREILKQITCWHSQRVFNAAAKMSIPVDEAHKWLGKPLVPESRKSIPVVRINLTCSRCRKRSYVYIPDFDEKRKERP